MADCTVCSRPDLADVHRTVDAGGGVNATAKAYGIPQTSFKRHLAHRADGPPRPRPPPAEPKTEVVQVALTEQPCAICRSPLRDQVDRMVLEGLDSSVIARTLGGAHSHDTVTKHRKRCIPEMLREAKLAGLAKWAGEARVKVRALTKKAEDLIEQATSDGSTASYKDRAACLNAAKGVLELLAKLTGELGPDVEVKILATPQWRAIQERIVVAVERITDPMARAQVAREMAAAMREIQGAEAAGSGAMVLRAEG